MNTASADGPAQSNRQQATLERLPGGTLELGASYLARADRALGREPNYTASPNSSSVPFLADEAAAHILRPLELVEAWPEPTDPLPVGGGAVHADLIEADLDALSRLRESLAADSTGGTGGLDAERLADEAQQWRLPVTPYRMPTEGGTIPGMVASGTRFDGAGLDGDGSARWPKPLSDCLVIDLSALWAGPLATSLLAHDGAQVLKLDPSCRPDAFGEHRLLYEHLNGHKEIVDFDLRVGAHREAFEQLVTGADLLVESFSRRVMPNLGYGPEQLHALNPTLITLSIVAFPAGTPEASWVSYGPGVHAASGLGALPTCSLDRPARFRPAPIAYPDALAGLAARALALESLAGSGGPSQPRHIEVSLLSAIAPLVANHAESFERNTLGRS